MNFPYPPSDIKKMETVTEFQHIIICHKASVGILDTPEKLFIISISKHSTQSKVCLKDWQTATKLLQHKPQFAQQCMVKITAVPHVQNKMTEKQTIQTIPSQYNHETS